jgi:mRNA-degrading endonuclease RelE of RelBE toxin-antitoxin system
MQIKIKFSKDFLNNLDLILQNNKSFSKKIEKIVFDFENNWFWTYIFSIYNIKKLNDNFFRLKIIPYRIIIKKDYNWDIIFDNIFKRKWIKDYKNYN